MVSSSYHNFQKDDVISTHIYYKNVLGDIRLHFITILLLPTEITTTCLEQMLECCLLENGSNYRMHQNNNHCGRIVGGELGYSIDYSSKNCCCTVRLRLHINGANLIIIFHYYAISKYCRLHFSIVWFIWSIHMFIVDIYNWKQHTQTPILW